MIVDTCRSPLSWNGRGSLLLRSCCECCQTEALDELGMFREVRLLLKHCLAKILPLGTPVYIRS